MTKVHTTEPAPSQEPAEDATQTLAGAKYRRYLPWIILLFALALFFFKLGALAFVGPDEPRYAQVAREMYQRHDWVTPTLLGDTWFEKPALLYWLMISCYHLLGVNEWAARLPNALFATLNLFIIYYLAKRSGNINFGFASAIVLAGSGLYFGLARAASFDMPLTFSFTAAFACFHLADTSNEVNTRRWWQLGFYAALGVSLLAKGLVGIVLIGAIVGLYILITGQLRDLFKWHPFAGLLVCLAVAALWYGPVIARHGWPFIDEFFVQHHFQRYTSNKYHHPGPIYFFVGVILLGVAPWSLLLIAAAMRAVRQLKSARGSLAALFQNSEPRARLLLLASLWLLIPLLFFSLSNSKLPGYILPVFPALALIIGNEIERAISGGELSSRWLLGSSLLLLVVGIALAFFTGKEFHLSSGGQILLAGIPIITAMLVFFWQRAPQRAFLAMASFSPLIAIAIALLLFPGIDQKASLAPLSRDAAAALQPGEKLIFFNYLQYTPFFYTDGRIVEGEKGEAVRIDNVEELARQLTGYPSMLCIVRQRNFELITSDARFQVTPISSQRDILLMRISLKARKEF